MKQTLTSLFKPYHPLQPIVAHRSTRMRGQAFVSFRDKETAERAKMDVHEFPLYGKPVVSSSDHPPAPLEHPSGSYPSVSVQLSHAPVISCSTPQRGYRLHQIISFARTRSDAVVRRADGEEGLEKWKAERLENKSTSGTGEPQAKLTRQRRPGTRTSTA